MYNFLNDCLESCTCPTKKRKKTVPACYHYIKRYWQMVSLIGLQRTLYTNLHTAPRPVRHSCFYFSSLRRRSLYTKFIWTSPSILNALSASPHRYCKYYPRFCVQSCLWLCFPSHSILMHVLHAFFHKMFLGLWYFLLSPAHVNTQAKPPSETVFRFSMVI